MEFLLRAINSNTNCSNRELHYAPVSCLSRHVQTAARHLCSTTVIFNGPGFSRVARFCQHFYALRTRPSQWMKRKRYVYPRRTNNAAMIAATVTQTDIGRRTRSSHFSHAGFQRGIPKLPRRRSTGNPLARCNAVQPAADHCRISPATNRERRGRRNMGLMDVLRYARWKERNSVNNIVGRITMTFSLSFYRCPVSLSFLPLFLSLSLSSPPHAVLIRTRGMHVCTHARRQTLGKVRP